MLARRDAGKMPLSGANFACVTEGPSYDERVVAALEVQNRALVLPDRNCVERPWRFYRDNSAQQSWQAWAYKATEIDIGRKKIPPVSQSHACLDANKGGGRLQGVRLAIAAG